MKNKEKIHQHSFKFDPGNIVTAISVLLQVVIVYGVVFGLWGMIFNNNFWSLFGIGVIVAIIFNILPIISIIFSQSMDDIEKKCSAEGAQFLLIIPIGVIGFIIFIIKSLFS